jgi:hypothetical protein
VIEMTVDWTTYSHRRIQDVEGIFHAVTEKWEEAEQWQIDHRNAMFACDVDQVLGEAVRALSFVLDAWARTKRAAAVGQVPNFYASHDAFARVFREGVSLCELVEPMVSRAKELEYDLEHEREFHEAAERIAVEQVEVDSQLPTFNRELMERSRKDDAEGRTRSVEELLDEFQGTDSASD